MTGALHYSKPKFSADQQQEIVAEYLAGKSVADLAYKHRCADHTIYRVLHRNGIQRHQRRKPLREPRPAAAGPPAPKPKPSLPIAPGLFTDNRAALARLMAGK